MTLSFASILPTYHWYKNKGIQPKNTTKRFSHNQQLYSIFDSHLKAELAVLTKDTDHLQKLFSNFFPPLFFSFYHLCNECIPLLCFVIGMAYSLSFSFLTLKAIYL